MLKAIGNRCIVRKIMTSCPTVFFFLHWVKIKIVKKREKVERQLRLILDYSWSESGSEFGSDSGFGYGSDFGSDCGSDLILCLVLGLIISLILNIQFYFLVTSIRTADTGNRFTTLEFIEKKTHRKSYLMKMIFCIVTRFSVI